MGKHLYEDTSITDFVWNCIFYSCNKNVVHTINLFDNICEWKQFVAQHENIVLNIFFTDSWFYFTVYNPHLAGVILSYMVNPDYSISYTYIDKPRDILKNYHHINAEDAKYEIHKILDYMSNNNNGGICK